MGIIRDIYEVFNKKNDPESVAQEVAELYIEKKENGVEHPIDTTVEVLMEKVRENPDPEKIKELLIAIIEQSKIPDRIFEKASTKILEAEGIPNTVITEVVRKSSKDIQDESIDKIIEEGNVGVNERIALIKNVNDEAILQKRVEKELKILYSVTSEKKDNEIVDRIEELENVLRNCSNGQIKSLTQRIVAKRMAENYYDDLRRGTKIYTLSRAIPVEEMIEIDMPQIVLEEYKKIEEEKGEKPGRINASELRVQILDKIAHKIVDRYKKAGVYLVPQSDNMKKLTQEEEQKFIDSIVALSEEELSKKDIFNIKEQIHGNKTQIRENQLIRQIKDLPQEDKMRHMDFISGVLEDDETLNTILMLKSSGLIEKLNSMTQNERRNAIETIGRVFENKRYKISKNIPRIKEEKKEDDGREEH